MATDRAVVLTALRLTGAGLTAAMGAIHLHLWDDGYRDLRWIGVLFLLNAIGAGLLAVALLAVPTRYLAVAAALGALFTAGTLAGLFISLTSGLLGFHESLAAPLVKPTIVVEATGCLTLAMLALLAHGSESPRP
ncbi:hypothetical protein [Streptomyces sp. XD-27]|uniref:hypothetical protein n=1 Tax=Streptomyces sp. XD-27 TaxID=3062779 RepID=UPI0026F41CCB|nr:hypothetical protein [Streptomyces sp. XD-27]WKX69317.1 hypothetical protein Q3Y56_04705 [Streptomyces sp. XD-27]